MPLDDENLARENFLANVVAYGGIFFVGLMLGVLILVILGGGAIMLMGVR